MFFFGWSHVDLWIFGLASDRFTMYPTKQSIDSYFFPPQSGTLDHLNSGTFDTATCQFVPCAWDLSVLELQSWWPKSWYEGNNFRAARSAKAWENGCLQCQMMVWTRSSGRRGNKVLPLRLRNREKGPRNQLHQESYPMWYPEVVWAWLSRRASRRSEKKVIGQASQLHEAQENAGERSFCSSTTLLGQLVQWQVLWMDGFVAVIRGEVGYYLVVHPTNRKWVSSPQL